MVAYFGTSWLGVVWSVLCPSKRIKEHSNWVVRRAKNWLRTTSGCLTVTLRCFLGMTISITPSGSSSKTARRRNNEREAPLVTFPGVRIPVLLSFFS